MKAVKDTPLITMTTDLRGNIISLTPGKIKWTKERLSVVARWVLTAMEHEKRESQVTAT